MGNENQYELGEKVISALHGIGKVHVITADKDYPVVVKFNRYPIANYYYSQNGDGLDSSCGTIKKATL